MPQRRCAAHRWMILLAGLMFSVPLFAASIDVVNKYAWAENAGWINWRDTVNNYGSAQVFADHLEGYVWAENIGWIRLGTHTTGGTHTYANTSPTDHGVNRSGNTLSGYAWGENIGWINFASANGGGVTIDAATGRFDGYAWSENVGWIHLKGTATNAATYGVTVITGGAVTLTSSTNPSTVGQNVTFTATVSGTPAPTGTVNFKDGGTSISGCASQALSSSSATCATASLTLGSHAITADYSGDGNYPTATGALSGGQTVNNSGGGGDPPEPPVTLTVTTTGSGTVSSVPAGIACGSDCSESYPANTAVTLTATAADGFSFSGWNGSCAGTAPTCALTLSATQTVTATFNAIAPPLLTVITTGGGTVTSVPAGITCGSDCSESYSVGAAVTLTATAASGYDFSGWSGGCAGAAPTCTLTLSANQTVTATFSASAPSLLTVTKTGNGTVTSVPAGINCGSDCSESYPANTAVTLTATAASGSGFTGWSGGCAGTAPTCALTLSADQTVTATATFSASASPRAAIGVLRNGQWHLDRSGNSAWDQCGSDGCDAFGQAGDMPVVGHWDGGDRSLLGVLRAGTAQWFLDRNGNGQWDGCGADSCLTFGDIGDLPVAADWSGDGKAKMGVFRAGNWYLDANGNGRWDGCGIDRCYLKVPDQSAPGFGLNGDLPIAGDWNGDGLAKVGVFRAGNWYFDDGNGQWDGCEIDRCHLKNPEQPRAGFGLGGDYPIVGDWNSDGVIKIGVFRNGSWFLDNGNGQWDGCGIDACVLRIPEQPNTGFGLPGDLPAVGRW